MNRCAVCSVPCKGELCKIHERECQYYCETVRHFAGGWVSEQEAREIYIDVWRKEYESRFSRH